MFSREEMDAYKKISAPNELKEKVANCTLKKRSIQMTTIFKITTALAACIALVVSMSVFLNNRSVDIVVSGQKLRKSVVFYDVSPTTDMRTSSMYNIPVEIKTERDAHLTVTHGTMTMNGNTPATNMDISEAVTVWWNLERSNEMPKCEMTIEQNGKKTLIILEFNDAEQKITAKKVIK